MRRGCVGLVASVMVLVGSAPIDGQWRPRFERPRAEIGANFDGLWVQSQSPFDRAVAQEWVELRLGGALGPEGGRPVVSLRLTARPYIGQGWADPHPGTDLDSDRLRGNALLTVAPTSQARVIGKAEVYQLFEPDALGGYQRQDNARWGAEYHDQNPLLPMKLIYSDRDESLILFSGAAQRALGLDRRLKEFRYQATNWKTRLFYRHLDVTTVTDARFESYLEDAASATNIQRWGKGSRMQNSVGYLRRQRDREGRSLNYSSVVHLQHTQSVYSEYEWQGERQSQAEASGRSTRARTRVAYEGGALSAWLEAIRRTNEFGPFSSRDLRVAPRVGVNHAFSPGVSLVGYLEVGHRWNAQGESGTGYVFVLDERHTLGVDGRIQLTNPFVDPGSVTLRSPEDGTLYEEGFDYQVQSTDPFWVAVALPGGRIVAGTEVVADYRYQGVPALSARALDLRTQMTLSLGGLSVIYFRQAVNDLEDRVAVPGVFMPSLRDLDQQQFALQYVLGRSRLQVTAFGALERFRAAGVFLDRKVGTVTARYQLDRRWAVSTRGRAIDSTGNTDPFLNYDAELRVIWQPLRAFRSEMFTSYYMWDGASGYQRFTGMGAALELSLERTRLSLLVDTVRRDVGLTRRENRVSLRFQQVVF